MARASRTDQGRRGPSWRSRRPLARLLIVSGVALIALFAAIQLVRPSHVFSDVGLSGMPADEADAVRIVLVEPTSHADQFLEGARLAAIDVNRNGGIAGRPLMLIHAIEDAYDETADLQRVVADSMHLADAISDQKNLLGVVGHVSSTTAIPASGLYDGNDVLFLASHATASSLTRHGFKTVFGLQPSNADIAAVMANHALRQGYRRFVLLADDTSYASEMVSFFRNGAALNGGEILFDGSLTSYRRSVERLILFLLDNELFKPADIDAIFLASSSVKDTAAFIKRARELGLTMPILGPEYLYSNLMIESVGDADMAGVVGASIYDGDSTRAAAVAFRQAFRKEYGIAPDQMGAIGYDAVHLLAQAAARAGGIEAGAVSDTLRIMRYDDPFEGVTGRLVFDASGLVTDTDVFVVRHDGSQFKTVASYTKPLDWTTITGPPTAPTLH